MLMSHRRRLKSEDDGSYFAAQTPLTGQRGGTAAVTCILLRLIKYLSSGAVSNYYFQNLFVWVFYFIYVFFNRCHALPFVTDAEHRHKHSLRQALRHGRSLSLKQ